MRTIIPNDQKALIREQDLRDVRDSRRELAMNRQANRELQQRIAEEASVKRAQRNQGTLYERVQRAAQRLEGMPAGAFVTLLESLSDAEREVHILAETYGQNRQELLRRFPRIRTKTTEEYLQAVNAIDEAQRVDDVPTSPEETPAKSRANRARKQEA